MKFDLDRQMMQKALQLAQQGEYSARPNPMVGCIIAQDDQIVAQGLHWQAGTAHAERNALLTQDVFENATAYITLEPCIHQGRTPPCIDALIAAKLKRVVIATADPNPLVAGKGIQALQNAGIEVTVGVLAKEARALNVGFFSRMRRRRPYVRAKVAMSLDGKIAMKTGESQWITNVDSRHWGHRLRAKSGAVLTSHATVKQDDCRLTVRDDALPRLQPEIQFQQPLRVVIDRQLLTSPQAQIFSQPGETVVVISKHVGPSKQQDWLNALGERQQQVKLIVLEEIQHHLNLQHLMIYLGEREINDVLLESGPQLLGALINESLIDELIVFIAPKLLGNEAIAMVDLPGIHALKDHKPVSFDNAQLNNGDVMITSRLSNFLETL